MPQVQHVAIVVLENANYSDVAGTSNMPYLNSLLSKGSLAAQYYANSHPSIPNYFMMTTGQALTNDDSFNGVVSTDNVARELTASGKVSASRIRILLLASALRTMFAATPRLSCVPTTASFTIARRAISKHNPPRLIPQRFLSSSSREVRPARSMLQTPERVR